jgi:hypothetical protein
VAERFPERGDPLGELARTLQNARVEAAARPERPDTALARELRIDYREDDGFAARIIALCRLAARHPLRSISDRLHRGPGEPSLSALAPAVRRLARDSGARVQALGGPSTHAVAHRLARLSGRPLHP